MHLDLLAYAVNNMRHRQLRSWLTVLGIVIGIAAVVALISVAQGLDASIRQQLSAFGNDFINIMPGNIEKGGGGSPVGAETGVLTENDVQAVRKVAGVRRAAGALEERVGMEYRGKNISLYAMGTEPLVAEIYGMKISEGRLPQEGDRGVAILGYSVAHDVFDERIGLNRRVKMGGRDFRVVGIFEKSGGAGPLSAMDSIVYIPLEDAREIMGQFRGNRLVSEIHAQAEPNADVREVEEALNAELMRLHKVNEDTRDFTVMTAEFVQRQVAAIMGLLTLFLGAVAGISLVVGAVGIANTMFMSVLERTRVIGTLKAIGASSGAILEVFLIESALIGVVGGLIGVAVGWLISLAINLFGFPAIVSPELALFALLFSTVVGVASGAFPARRAAGLEAVQALGYE